MIAPRCPLLHLALVALTAAVLAVPAHAADNGLIAGSGIRLMNPDGTNVHFIGAFGGNDPAWSRDGTQIAFTITNDGIWIMDADGSDQRRIVFDSTLCCATLSPDASQVAVEKPSTHEIKIYNVANGNLVRTFTPPTDVFYQDPSWSPLGDLIAITVADVSFIWDDPDDPNDFPNPVPKIDIGVLPAGGGSHSLVKEEPIVFDMNGNNPKAGFRDKNPDWSPDGSMFVLERAGGIATLVIDGGDFVQLTGTRTDFHAGGGVSFPQWSPDGEKILFQDDRPDGLGIYVMDANGANLHLVTSATLFRPDWQPLPAEDTLTLRFDPSRTDLSSMVHYEVGSDGFQRSIAIAQVNDLAEHPKAGVDVVLIPNVHVDPINTANPRNVVCEINGPRLWPGRIGPTLDFLERPELTTNSNGEVRVQVLAGTQVGGEWLLDVEEADDEEVTDGEVLRLIGDAAASSVSADALTNALVTQLVVARFTLSPRGTKQEKQESLLEWLGQLRWTASQEASFEPTVKNSEFGPIHTAGGHAGIVFYAGRSSPNPLLNYMQNGSNPGDPANYVVLDVDVLQGANVDDNTPHLVLNGDLPTLAEWEADIGTKALPGRLTPVTDEDLTYFGYPYPPPGGIPGVGSDRGSFDRCIPLPGLSATVRSPVNLLFTNGNGDSFGIDAQGVPHFDAPGVMANANGDNPSGYVVPVGDYTVTLSGTDKGKAFITFQMHDEITDFALKSKEGASGELQIEDGDPAPELTFGGKTVPATEHGMGKEARACAAGKKKCVAKKLSGLLKCYVKAAGKGVLDPACLAKVRAKFDGGADPSKACFAKVEKKGGCITENDVDALEAHIDAAAERIVEALDPAAPGGVSANKCLAGKLKCVAKRNDGYLGCLIKAEKTGIVDSACIAKVVIGYTSCFTKVEGKGDCLTTGDAGPLGGASNAAVAGLVCDLDPLRQLFPCP